jgi:hypothetical protein
MTCESTNGWWIEFYETVAEVEGCGEGREGCDIPFSHFLMSFGMVEIYLHDQQVSNTVWIREQQQRDVPVT